MKHTTEITVRSYECDSYNHVNNAVYLNYLEHARMDFLHAANFDYKGIVGSVLLKKMSFWIKIRNDICSLFF